MCGEKTFEHLLEKAEKGSPPHVRGKVRLPLGFVLFLKDHPRMCGEKCVPKRWTTCGRGSPPHVRGKENFRSEKLDSDRITPACAGKSFTCGRCSSICQDHPRMCGEKLIPTVLSARTMGSPPHVRGKAYFPAREAWKGWITPACAGKSRCRSRTSPDRWDHPRMCGEKHQVKTTLQGGTGLPPHVRGKGCFSYEAPGD